MMKSWDLPQKMKHARHNPSYEQVAKCRNCYYYYYYYYRNFNLRY